MAERKITSFTTPILIGLLVVASFLAGMFWTRIRYLEQEKASEKVVQVTPTPSEEGVVLEELASTIGRFLITEDELCQEDGKPLIYMFGSSGCPHCTWEHPIFEKVTAKFADLISVHDNMDTQNDTDVFQKYSQINQGGIPFLVLGCRYVRVGSGENAGEVEEEKNLTALICKLTGGEPTEVCQEVADLVEQIE